MFECALNHLGTKIYQLCIEKLAEMGHSSSYNKEFMRNNYRRYGNLYYFFICRNNRVNIFLIMSKRIIIFHNHI
jgi:hypothetical protein